MKGAEPKLFISYSWTSSDHEDWVLRLAEELRGDGVDVILDKWDLKEGQDAHAFMERMVTDEEISKVAMICDRLYAKKADVRSGGVGAETQIITPEVYEQQEQTKFVAVLAERDEEGRPYLPSFHKSRKYIDLSTPDLYLENYETLLRWVYDKPLHVKPEIGNTPAFLDADSAISLSTTAQFRRSLRAVRECRPYCYGALRDYFRAFAENLERFRITHEDGKEFDEVFLENIDRFLPHRNEVIELLVAVAKYRATQESWAELHRFIESLLPYMFQPEDLDSWRDWDWDNFKFLVHEIFLCAIAVLLRDDCFAGAAHLLRQPYYIDGVRSPSDDSLFSFSVMSPYLRILEHRNQRLKLNRLSVQADLLRDRVKTSGLSLQQLMQADFVLWVRDALECLRSGRRQQWPADTLVYAGRQRGPFEIFARSRSALYFERTKKLFDVDGKDELVRLEEAVNAGTIRAPRLDSMRSRWVQLMGPEGLGTLP